jgi:hypothetical protein
LKGQFPSTKPIMNTKYSEMAMKWRRLKALRGNPKTARAFELPNALKRNKGEKRKSSN